MKGAKYSWFWLLGQVIIGGRLDIWEINNSDIGCIFVVGDIAGVVLADSAAGACFVASCMAFVDTVQDCGYSGGGVFGTYKNYFIFAGEDTGSSGKAVGL